VVFTDVIQWSNSLLSIYATFGLWGLVELQRILGHQSLLFSTGCPNRETKADSSVMVSSESRGG